MDSFEDGRPYAHICAGAGYWDEHHGFELTGLITEADAKLVTAAPVLLEALRAIADAVEECDGEWGDFVAELAQARAAIRSAQGD